MPHSLELALVWKNSHGYRCNKGSPPAIDLGQDLLDLLLQCLGFLGLAFPRRQPQVRVERHERLQQLRSRGENAGVGFCFVLIMPFIDIRNGVDHSFLSMNPESLIIAHHCEVNRTTAPPCMPVVWWLLSSIWGKEIRP